MLVSAISNVLFDDTMNTDALARCVHVLTEARILRSGRLGSGPLSSSSTVQAVRTSVPRPDKVMPFTQSWNWYSPVVELNLNMFPVESSWMQVLNGLLTAVMTVDELFAGFGSMPSLVTVAVLTSDDPAPDVTLTPIMKVTGATGVPDGGSRFRLQVTVPPLPTGGVSQDGGNAVPGAERRANVVPGGNGSVNTILFARPGPKFDTVNV